jgi:hypothetical protein
LISPVSSSTSTRLSRDPSCNSNWISIFFHTAFVAFAFDSNLSFTSFDKEPEWRSRYSDRLRARRPNGRSLSPGSVKNFLFSTSSRKALGFTQPSIQWVPGDISPGVKRQGNEANHSPTATAEVKNMWIYTSTPPHAFIS